MKTYKVIVSGPAMCGKTKSINTLLNASSTNPSICDGAGHLGIGPNTLDNWQYHPTMGVEIHPIAIGNVCFNVWDTAGNPQFYSLRNGYFSKADFVVIFQPSNEDITSFVDECHVQGEIPYTIVSDGSMLKETLFNMHVNLLM